MATSVNEKHYRVFIPGLHRDGITDSYNLCAVKVYKPEFNILKWELEFDGFRIEDFPNIDLFNVIDGQQAEKECYFVEDYDYDKYLIDGALYCRVDKVSPDDELLFASTEYLWLENEVVSLTNVDDEGDYWLLTLERSLTEIDVNGNKIATSFFGTKPKCYFSRETIGKIAGEDDSKKWTHTYRLQRNKLNLDGLTVELRDIDNNSLEYVGIIKSVHLTDGTAIIDCKSILTALETELSFNQIQAITNYGHISFGELIKYCYLISDIDIRLTPTTGTSRFSNILGSFSSDIPFYIDSEKLNELISKNSLFAKQIRINNIVDSTDGAEKTIKVSDILNFLLFTTGSIVYQEKGIISFLDILTPVNAMDSTIITPVDLMDKVQTPKHVTTRFPRFSRVNIQTENGSLIYTFPDGAGIKGSNEISFDLSTFPITDEFKRMCFDSAMNFSRINQYILSVLKVEIPEDLSEMELPVGMKFEIDDIEEFDTFQKKGSEEFTNGLILNRDGNEVEIGVTTQQFFQPIAPCWKVDFVSYDDGTEIVLYDVTNLDEFLTQLTINGKTPESVYDKYLYSSDDGDSFAVLGSFPTSKIYLLFNEDWVNLGWAGSLEDETMPTYLKLINNALISEANLETVKYIVWGYSGEYNFAKYFFQLGGHKWV